MTITLQVAQAFDTYRAGDQIPLPDTAALALLKAFPGRYQFASSSAGPGPGTPTVIPTQPNAVTPVIGNPDPALAATYGFALDLTSTPAILYKWLGTTWSVALQAGSGGGTAPAVPANTAPPGISGTAQVGQALACSTGTWSGSPTTFAYQWQRNGAAIANATGAGYTPVAADVGAVLTCAVTASNATGASQAAVSGATGQVAAAPAVPVLQALGLSSLAATVGVAFSATISGQTAGSTVTATSSDGAVLSVASGQVSGTFASAGSPTVTLTETLSGATGSPKSTQLVVTVSAAAPAQPSGIGADLNDAMNTTIL